ncbi:hypothetical protein ACJJTC_005055 [Scirpophaga incertulas]
MHTYDPIARISNLYAHLTEAKETISHKAIISERMPVLSPERPERAGQSERTFSAREARPSLLAAHGEVDPAAGPQPKKGRKGGLTLTLQLEALHHTIVPIIHFLVQFSHGHFNCTKIVPWFSYLITALRLGVRFRRAQRLTDPDLVTNRRVPQRSAFATT